MESVRNNELKIGWAQADLTPTQAVSVCGQFHARVSERVNDPLTATVLVLDGGGDCAILISCDLAVISEELRDAVRSRVRERQPSLDVLKLVMNATHTHTAPEVRQSTGLVGGSEGDPGVDLPTTPVAEYIAFAAERIAQAVVQAWTSRAAGSVAFGQGTAVVGRNRRWVDLEGRSTMYGKTDTPTFSHIEGYEDHSLNLLTTRDAAGRLTGLVVNVPCPSQVSENQYFISADYWHETRQELRRRLGENLFILPQCSAAGDQSPHLLFEKKAAGRMLEITGRTVRQEIAHRIATAAESIVQALAKRADPATPLRHEVHALELPQAQLTEEQAQSAAQEAEKWQSAYEQEQRNLRDNPSLKQQPHWYHAITLAWRRAAWNRGVVKRFEAQKDHPTIPAELHIIRLGDIAFATNPFEYYLDFGTYIKARSPATQTFLVQLAGAGTYVPSRRSTTGGGYGAVPASNPLGPDSGRQVAETTIESLQRSWAAGAVSSK